MKKILIIFGFFFVAFGCSSDDKDTNNIDNLFTLKLSKFKNSKEESNLTYQNGFLSKIITNITSKNTRIAEYRYENNRVKEIYSYEQTSTGAKLNSSTLIFGYTGSKITSSTTYQNGINYAESYTYTNDLLTNTKSYNTDGILASETNYTYFSDGNLKKATTSLGEVYNYNAYDDKQSYVKSIFTAELMSLYNNPVKNILSGDFLYPGITTPFVYSYQYEYNSFGYPITITSKSVGNSGEISYLEYK